MTILILIILIVGILLGLRSLMQQEKRAKEALKSRVETKYSPDVVRYGVDGHFIGFRFDADTVIYGNRVWDVALPMSALKAVEVRKDGVTLTRTNRGSQLAGAAVGGLAFGGVGAIIGGLSGSTTATERIKSLGLAFAFEDRYRPFHEVTFGVWPGNGVPINGIMAADAARDADLIRAHVMARMS